MSSFDRSDTATKVIDLVAQELKIDKSEVKESSVLVDIGADSLDMVEIMMKLEELFGIEISDEDSEHLKTVADLINYIQKARTK